jgi:hypothetical protein
VPLLSKQATAGASGQGTARESGTAGYLLAGLTRCLNPAYIKHTVKGQPRLFAGYSTTGGRRGTYRY